MISALQQILLELEALKKQSDAHARIIRQLVQQLPRQEAA